MRATVQVSLLRAGDDVQSSEACMVSSKELAVGMAGMAARASLMNDGDQDSTHHRARLEARAPMSLPRGGAKRTPGAPTNTTARAHWRAPLHHLAHPEGARATVPGQHLTNNNNKKDFGIA